MSTQTYTLSRKQLLRKVIQLENKLKRQKKLKCRSNNKLCTKLCLKLLLPLAKHWHNLGIFLGLPESTLEQIETDYDLCTNCLREMIKSWLRQLSPLPSWTSLAEAVQEFDPKRANDIRIKYCS